MIGVNTSLTGIANGTNNNHVGTATSPLNPRLNPLANNGGPTQTMSLPAGSIAIGAGGSLGSASAVASLASTITVADGAAFASTSLPIVSELSFTTQPTNESAGNPINPPVAVQELGLTYFCVQIEGELMAVEGLTLNADGSATLDVVRGAVSTAVVSHPANSAVYLVSDQRGALTNLRNPAMIDAGAYQSSASTFVPTYIAVPGAAVALSISHGVLNGKTTASADASGTATFGNLSVPAGGTYALTATAVGAENVTSGLFTVSASANITSANQATFATGQSGTFTAIATGYPAATFSEDRHASRRRDAVPARRPQRHAHCGWYVSVHDPCRQRHRLADDPAVHPRREQSADNH